jgi:cyclic pyranopterin phosphate synthase
MTTLLQTIDDTSSIEDTASIKNRPGSTPMVDPYGRHVTYLRLSVTDRCDLRCTYCMPEKMKFLPKRDLLTLEELDRLASAFITKGVRKLRITGGEPLVRKDVLTLIQNLSRYLDSGQLDEITLTTNGTQLETFAQPLAAAGVKRINVSIDSLDPENYSRITRGGNLAQVLAGIAAAQNNGISIKLNAVALKQDNLTEIPSIISWAHDHGMDFTLIEVMPMGDIDGDRFDQYISLKEVRKTLETRWDLSPVSYRTSGPASYFEVAQTGGRLGFITPLSHNFCEACNRVRLTCTGQLYSCLGQNGVTDLRNIMRRAPHDMGALHGAIDGAITRKPKGHDFEIKRSGAAPAVSRIMSTTGG